MTQPPTETRRLRRRDGSTAEVRIKPLTKSQAVQLASQPPAGDSPAEPDPPAAD